MIKTSRWQSELERWLQPFLQRFSHKKQARWAPFYLRGLLSEGRRKSIEPLAERVAPGQIQQLHHFVSTSRWVLEPQERLLAQKADALVGGNDALLIVDDTALVKKGRHSAGVGHQYCGELGKKANCQALVSLTLARGEVPVPIGLRLFLPDAWDEDTARRAGAKIPEDLKHRPKWRMALAEIDRRYYLSNLPPQAKALALARLIKGRWACEQAHQQMKQELGLDHYEGRNWLGLHHHALLVMMAYCFLQWLRLKGKKGAPATVRRPSPACPRSPARSGGG